MTSDRLIAHYRMPDGSGLPEACTDKVDHRNLSCGDAITLGWRVEAGIIADIGYEIAGCMMHKASASILCRTMKGRNVAEADAIIRHVRNLSDAGLPMTDAITDDLAALAEIRSYPTRRKCVLLSWEALEALASAASRTPAE